MINRAIRELIPNEGWRMANPVPENETQFNERFEIQTGFDSNNDATYSNDPSDFGITWSQVQAKVTELTNNEPIELLRLVRNSKLKETDWTQLADIPDATKNAWQTYRQSLRDITDTYSSLEDDGFTWPTEP